jgi:subtilisin family serine protease
MSLGGGSPNSTEESAFNNFVNNGGLVVAAAGNDGNTTRSYPAGYPSIMMVGANDANGNIADFSQFPSCDTTTGRGKKRRTVTDETICVEITAGGVNTLSTYPVGLGSVASLMADNTGFANAAMDNNGSASGNSYFMGTAESTDSAALGKICMIDRGNISFHDKVANCESSGGVGAVIINNVPGMLYGTLGSPNLTSIPAVGADLSDRSALVNSVTASINISTGDYGYMSGTSMATPAVAGVAALIWSHYPDCTGEQVRTVLKTTALDAGDAGHDEKFGSGIVQADSALSKLAVNCGEEGDGGGDPSGLFNLSTHTYKVKGIQHVDLSWDSTSENVNVFKDGVMVGQDITGYSFTHNIGSKGGGSYIYKICEVTSNKCSDDIPAIF